MKNTHKYTIEEIEWMKKTINDYGVDTVWNKIETWGEYVVRLYYRKLFLLVKKLLVTGEK